MTEVRQGCLEAMAPLFERYQGPLLNFFFRLTGDRETSRDLTQTVFERIIRYRQSYRADARFRPWVYQTARNVLADHRRRHSRLFAEPLAAAGEPFDGEAPAEPPDHSWREKREARELQDALDRLPADDRELVVLSRFHGMRYDEIAVVMEKSVAAVKVQAHRAIHALRRIYFEKETFRET